MAYHTRILCTHLANTNWVVWSLELASEVFHDFSAYDHGGGGDAHSAGRNSKKSAVAIGKEFGIVEE